MADMERLTMIAEEEHPDVPFYFSGTVWGPSLPSNA